MDDTEGSKTSRAFSSGLQMTKRKLQLYLQNVSLKEFELPSKN